MNVLFGLMISLFTVSAFSQNIQVVVDGKVYQCSGNNGGLLCSEAALRAKNKFNACKTSGGYPSECFKAAYTNTTENKTCPQWSEDCHEICKFTGGYPSECYSYCY